MFAWLYLVGCHMQKWNYIGARRFSLAQSEDFR